MVVDLVCSTDLMEEGGYLFENYQVLMGPSFMN